MSDALTPPDVSDDVLGDLRNRLEVSSFTEARPKENRGNSSFRSGSETRGHYGR
jgi:hypothetical protein